MLEPLNLKYLFFSFLLVSFFGAHQSKAQELGYTLGTDKFLVLSQDGMGLTGSITTIDPLIGFIHVPVSGTVEPKSDLINGNGDLWQIEIPDYGMVPYARTVEDLNTVYEPLGEEWPRDELKIKGFTNRIDTVASEYLDHYNNNTALNGANIVEFANEIDAAETVCADSASTNFSVELTEKFCEDWGAPLSVGIITARENLGLWESVAASLETPSEIRTIDNRTAVFVTSPKVLGLVAKATDFKFADEVIDLSDTKIVTGFSATNASAAAAFSVNPSFITVKWSIKDGGDFFELIWRNRSNTDEINKRLVEVANFFSPHDPSCSYILRDEPRVYCYHTTHDNISRGDRLWVRVGHLLVNITRHNDGTLEFLSVPQFQVSYFASESVPPPSTFSRLKDSVPQEVSAAEEAVCIWQSGLLQMFGEDKVTYQSKASCS